MKRTKVGHKLVAALAISSLTSCLLYLIGVRYYQAGVFWFLNWNLLLAWIPLGIMLVLVNYLKRNPWMSWRGLLLSALWLGFLPNSFYLISDFIHLTYPNPDNLLYYVVLLFSFSFNGIVLGFLSLYLLHKELLKRLTKWTAHSWIASIILLCSFALYVGRYLRWNTWDIVVNPAGVLFDVSDRILNPIAYGQTFQVTFLFFVLLSSMYFTFWSLIAASRQDKII